MTIQEIIKAFEAYNGGQRLTAEQVKRIETNFSPEKIKSITNMVKNDPHFTRFYQREIRIFNQPYKKRQRLLDVSQPTEDTLSLTYVLKMVCFILTFSKEQNDYNVAKLEWDLISVKYEDVSIKCNMCKNADIHYQYEIRNRNNGICFLIGCDCIRNYMSVSMHEKSKLLLKEYNRLNPNLTTPNVPVLKLSECSNVKINKRSGSRGTAYKPVKTHCNSTLKSKDGSREPEGLTISKNQLAVFYKGDVTKIPNYGVMTFIFDGKEGVASINDRGAFINYKEVQRLGMPKINMGHRKRTGEKITVNISITGMFETLKGENTKLKNKKLEELTQKLH
jgi:hypothetical protein